MSVTTIAKIAGIVAKMRADLQAVGGFDNGMLGVPAAGVRTNIEALEAALAASEVQAEPALSDSTIDAAAEAAYWQFDARRKGYAEWRGAPQSERDAFKAEARALARGHFPVRADEVRPAAPQQPAPRVPQAEPVLSARCSSARLRSPRLCALKPARSSTPTPPHPSSRRPPIATSLLRSAQSGAATKR